MGLRVVSLLWLLMAFNFARAQQNFFNVPSSDITVKHKLFFQQQFNAYNILQSNTTLTYGLGKNWEIGLNLFNGNYAYKIGKFQLNSDNNVDAVAPLAMINIQKVFKFNDVWHIGIGSLGGFNIPATNYKASFVNFSYINSCYTLFNDQFNFTTGVYYVNKSYAGQKQSVGVMVGSEVNLYKDKIHFVGDCLVGKSNVAVAVLGFSFFVKPVFPISVGWQIPFSSVNTQALVVELTYNPNYKAGAEKTAKAVALKE